MGTSDSTRQEQSSQSSRSPWVRPARWGMGSSATANNSPIPSLPSALCAPPKPSNSSSTCRTSSPSPRLRETEDESAAVASPGFGFGRRREGSPSRGPTPQPQHTSAASADTSWGQFDGPPGPASCGSSGRELQRRKCTFRVFVVFRGGWCTTSHSLLRGFVGLNPHIKRAGGRIIAISSQTTEQVTRAARELRIPFEVFGDPTNQLVEEMNRRFDMGCTVSMNEMVTDAYPRGMAQPCVLAVYTDRAQDRSSVLFKWSRWQTIATMRHEDTWAEIVRALSIRENPSLATPSPTGTSTTASQTPHRYPTPSPHHVPPPGPSSDSRSLQIHRRTGASFHRPRLASNSSQASTTGSTTDRSVNQPTRFPSMRQHISNGGVTASRGMGHAQNSQRQQQLPQHYQPSPSRRMWRFGSMGSTTGGLESFTDTPTNSTAPRVPRSSVGTPARSRRPARNSVPEVALHLRTHTEERESEDDNQDEDSDDTIGEEKSNDYSLSSARHSVPMVPPSVRGVPARSTRWGSSSTFARRPVQGNRGAVRSPSPTSSREESHSPTPAPGRPPRGYMGSVWGP